MKTNHILNIGYPKSGTTWLWHTLVKNKSIPPDLIKENTCLITGTPVTDYFKLYTEDVTANFNPSNIILDQYIIEQLSQNPNIRVSVILRHPVELLWSLYNFLKISNVDFKTYCYQMYDAKWITSTNKIIDRWKNYFGNRFEIFWYDDLLKDNVKFYLDYCKTMHLDPGPATMIDKMNITFYKNIMPPLDKDILDLLDLEYKNILRYK